MAHAVQVTLDILAKDLGLDDLTLSPDGNTALSIDDVEIGITLMSGSGQLRLLSIIGDMPETDGKELAHVLLAANHLGGMTEGAAIGYDTEADLVTLNLSLPVAGIDADALAAALETMASTTLAWRENLPVLRDIDAAAARSETPAGAGGDASTWMRA